MPADVLTFDQLATLDFLTGIDGAGALTEVTGWRWNGDTPATYTDAGGSAHKWGDGTAESTGGLVTYCFDEGSNWSSEEQSAFQSALALWSAVANIAFTCVDSVAGASLVFYRYGSTTAAAQGVTLEGGAYASANYVPGAPGDRTVPQTQSAYISLDTSQYYWSDITSFTRAGGYALGTVVHELGHVLGLDHAGPYNGEVTPATQQYNTVDTRLWSVMSYIRPEDTSASYFGGYPVTGTQWGLTPDSYYPAPTTFMPLDILAMQRLYGLPASTPLNDVNFGFNCTIADACRPFFDFTANTTPIVTLYATGLDNTLDLSGWSSDCVVDLNPGSFSSTCGLTNNIGIAYGTWINTAIGGAGDDRFIVNDASNEIDGGGGTNTALFDTPFTDYAASRAADGTVTLSAGTLSYTLRNVRWLQFTDRTIDAADLPCFAAGTRIATTRGAVAVEALRVGDHVLLARGGTAPVAWLGHREVACARHPRPHDIMPVRVRAHAFGPGRPHADLLLSPDHAVFADGVLLPVRYLVNGATVVQETVARIEYWHVELPAHDVLLAEGLPAESYLDTGNRGAFANGGAAVALHPDFARDVWARKGCAELVTSGAELEAVRSVLLEQAEALGWRLSTEPEIALEVAGRRIAPRRDGARLRFDLPAGAREARLLSRSFVPAEVRCDSEDRRRLGVALAALWLDGAPVPLDSPRLGAGWREPEPGWRWTDGAGAIALDGALVLEATPCMAGPYWQAPPRTVPARSDAAAA